VGAADAGGGATGVKMKAATEGRTSMGRQGGHAIGLIAMKIAYIAVFGSTIIAIMPAKAQTTSDIEYYEMSGKKTNHIKLYNFGKALAAGWSQWLKAKGRIEKKTPSRTRNEFMGRALVGYQKLAIIDENNKRELYYCYLGYSSTAEKQSWSSVHTGLLENLSGKYKAIFLSLPER